MGDQRQHRGPHPEDERLFARSQWPVLRVATSELSWLLTRGYAPFSALKLVGDRHTLDARQRLAVARSAGSDQAVERRRSHQVFVEQLAGAELWIDGYNVLTTVEAALAHGVLLLGRDGCCRDMASMHGSYRQVHETVPALELLGELLSRWHVAECRWLLDQPVSNSGRLRAVMLDLAATRGWCWRVELTTNPDPLLAQASAIVATADSQVLDVVERWFNLARLAVELKTPTAYVVDLGSPDAAFTRELPAS